MVSFFFCAHTAGAILNPYKFKAKYLNKMNFPNSYLPNKHQLTNTQLMRSQDVRRKLPATPDLFTTGSYCFFFLFFAAFASAFTAVAELCTLDFYNWYPLEDSTKNVNKLIFFFNSRTRHIYSH